MDHDYRNLIMAIALSGLILLGWDAMFPTPEAPTEVATTTAPSTAPSPTSTAPSPTSTPTSSGIEVPGGQPSVSVAVPGVSSVAELLAQSKRVSINSQSISGSISLNGGRMDDVILNNYNVKLNEENNKVRVFSPKGQVGSYFAEYGWVGKGFAPGQLPGADTPWQTTDKVLSENSPVKLTWDNGNGLKFTRTVSIDNDYMFSINQTVENNSGHPISLNPYALISRWGTPDVTGFFILHEGLLGVLDGTLTEIDYSDLVDDGASKAPTTGGWVGITDKYWLAALIPDQKTQVDTRFVHRNDAGIDKYQTDFLGAQMVIQPGSSVSSQSRLFAGAKEVTLLDGYTDNEDVARLDLAVDFGWFYFMTKPIFYALNFFHSALGNFGLGILLLTVIIKLIFFPLANKSYKAMAKMRELQPEIKILQERYKEDKTQLNQQMMALYKKKGANPAAGCLPIVVQIPVFFALYKVLFVTIEMRHAPFFGWIQDLSAPDPTTLFNLFGLIPWTPPDFLMIGIWPLMMGISMFLQQKLNPQPTDPIQAKVFMFLPILFTFLLAPFPAGLVVYWAWNNTLSILQQWTIMKRMGVK
ncbi:MAG: membrane protein insertase YidC [Rhodospirillaceae bacterium]|nr:membrane protein insertase YidC [Rhodospirillaceae bacterium]